MGCMLYNVEAFIALASGLEMLERISSIAYWGKLNFHKELLELLYINDFYNVCYFLRSCYGIGIHT